MKILLTGVAGFVGSHAAERLLAEGHAVTGIDNFEPYYDPALKRRNLEAVQKTARALGSKTPAKKAPDLAAEGSVLLPGSEGGAAGQAGHAQAAQGAGPSFQFVEGDFGDRALLDRVLAQNRFDAVIHLAAQAGVRPSIDDPLKYLKVNVTSLVTLLEALRAHGPKRIVAASSSSVYGNVTPAPFREDAPCVQPQSPYGASKRAGEIFLGTFAKLHGFRAVVVRPFTVYGPRQRPDMAIAAFARKLILGEPITLFGDGSSARDYTFVADIVDGLMGALVCPVEFGLYNLGGDHPVSLSELVAALEKAVGKQAVIKREKMQAGDVERTSADLTRSRKDLGYSPKVSLEEGLRQTVAWVREELAREGRRV
ncbi:MAG: GDP-mannose 4,6-dehydratase [Planctomycetes bacterium]|nr:GDP-mannose 4,6-dehydratase [Planctomycetota bacterium]